MQHGDVVRTVLAQIARDFDVVVAIRLERRTDLAGGALVKPMRLRRGDVAGRVLVELDAGERRVAQRAVDAVELNRDARGLGAAGRGEPAASSRRAMRRWRVLPSTCAWQQL